MIPSPALLFEDLLERRREAEVAKIPPPPGDIPVKPADFTLAPTDLAAANYLQVAAQYGVTKVPPPPPMASQISQPASSTENVNGSKWLTAVDFHIPQDYHAVTISVSGDVDRRASGTIREVQFSLDTATVELFPNNGDLGSAGLNNLTGDRSVNVHAFNIKGFSATIILHLELDAAVLKAWQYSAFDQIKAAYDALQATYKQDLADYETKQAQYRAQQEQLRKDLKNKERSRDPFYNREIEQAELKRSAIYLMGQEFDRTGAINGKSEPCGYPELNRPKADEFGYDWYFWDRAFDWGLMNYSFFDYFWNQMCSWPSKFDPDDPDALFKAFRRAGYARVFIPVAEGMEEDLAYYFKTGIKWGYTGKPPADPNDTRWRDLVTEIRHQRDCYQSDREGQIDFTVTVSTPNVVGIHGSDRYWDVSNGIPDQTAISDDTDREIFIDCVAYRIVGIALSAISPTYTATTPNSMWWDATLDRPFKGDMTKMFRYSIGAKFIGAPFLFELPTELVWTGAHDDCLPCYPLPNCGQ